MTTDISSTSRKFQTTTSQLNSTDKNSEDDSNSNLICKQPVSTPYIFDKPEINLDAEPERDFKPTPYKRTLVWRNIIALLVMHIVGLYAFSLIPSAKLWTMWWVLKTFEYEPDFLVKNFNSEQNYHFAGGVTL